jgi:hypothetical protein
MKQLILIFINLLIFNVIVGQKLTKNSQYFLTDEKGNRISQVFSSLDDFDDAGNAVFSIGGNAERWGPIKGAKYGIINKNGKIILPATFDYLDKWSYNNDSLYKFGKGENLGLLHINGTVYIPAIYKYINTVYSNPSIIIAEMENNYARIYSTSGKTLSPLFQDLKESNGNFEFKINGYEGFMNAKYVEVLKPEFIKCEELTNGAFLVQDKTLKTYLLNKKGGMEIQSKYDEIDVEYGSDYSNIAGFKITLLEKEGYMDANYKIVLKPEFKNINRITFGCDDYIFSVQKNRDEYYLYSKTGKLLSKKKYKYLESSLVFDKYIIGENSAKSKKNKKSDDYYEDETSSYVLLDLHGKELSKLKFEDYKVPYSYNNETLLLLKINGSWIGYNEQLLPVLNHPIGSKENFTYLESLGDGLYLVQIGGKDEGYGKPEGGVFGIFNQFGEQVLPIAYEDIEMSGYGNDRVLLIKKNGKYGIHEISGEQILDYTYTKIDRDDELCVVKNFIEKIEAERYGLISTMTGKVNIPVNYSSLTKVYSTDYYLVSENNKFGILNSQGKVITPIRYNYLESANLDEDKEVFLVNIYGTVKDGYYGMEVEGGNWGVINTKGDTLMPIVYSKILFINDTVVQVTDLDKNAFLLNFPSLTRITNQDVNYIDKLGYSYDNPKFIIGKNVTLSEYGNAEGGLYGVTDLKGNKIADCIYSEIEEVGDNYVCNYPEFDGFDLLDQEGNVLVKHASVIQRLTDTVFIIQKEGNVTLFNVNSKLENNLNGAIDFKAPDYFYRGAIVGIKNKKDIWGAINENGDWIIKPQYCDIVGNDENYLIVGKCDGVSFKYGVVDLGNNILIPFEYDAIEEEYGAEFKCVLGNKLYTKNLSNEVLEVENATDENIRD